MSIKSSEVHSIFHDFFKEELVSLGFKKRNNSYIYRFDDELELIFNLQIDKWGWNMEEGCSYIYVLMPVFKKWSALNIVPDQIRFFEVLQGDPSLIDDIAEHMNRYTKKLPGNIFNRLTRRWTIQKIKKNEGSWFFYYDKKDLEAWQKLLKPVVLNIIQENIEKLAKTDRKILEEEINRPVQHAIIHVDPRTGKTTLLDKQTKEEIKDSDS